MVLKRPVDIRRMFLRRKALVGEDFGETSTSSVEPLPASRPFAKDSKCGSPGGSKEALLGLDNFGP
jgi:hypothetical protein